MTGNSRLAVAGLALMLVSATAYAHRNATGIVKQRMDAMTSMGDAMKTLGAMIRGTHDAGPFKAYAETIARHGGDELTTLFPEGSLDHPTRAVPAIWTDWDHFVRLARELELQAGNLASAPPDERDAVFKRMRQTCSDCHRSFRTKK